ncbi:MAG: NAD(P)H-dependent oxidoreductase [Pseudomonadota bacterium]|nr:NAD(P)H-dependent oxidoreductase [Pseudomonadota bacterium]
MNILIVSAIAEPQSFGGQMLEKSVRRLNLAGHGVTMSDLYAQRFPAVAYANDFPDRTNTSYFALEREQAHHYRQGTLPPVIRAEQEKINAADLIIFMAPTYWSSPPAIMRGWIDQVFTPEFAYGKDRTVGNGPLNGKSAFFVMTHAGLLGAADPLGVPHKLDEMLKALHDRPLRYSGITPLPPLSVQPPYYTNEIERTAALNNICQAIEDHVANAALLSKAVEIKQNGAAYPLIHINGRPGVGKKTVGSILAKQINAAFIDNHTLLNPAVQSCGRGSDGYSRVVRKVVEAVFEELQYTLQEKPVVLTNCLTEQVAEHRLYYKEIQALAKKANTDFVPIQLSADFNENARRIVTPSRAKAHKLTDADTLKQLYKDFTVVNDPNSFELDTTHLKARQSAAAIKRHLKDKGYQL